MIKKASQASRWNSIKDPLDFFSPIKHTESLFQKTTPLPTTQAEHRIQVVTGPDSEYFEDEYIDTNECEMVLKSVLKPYKISYVFLDFLGQDYVFYKFHGNIWKQSKVIK